MHQGGVLALSSLVREVAVGVQPQRLLFELMAEVIIPAEPLRLAMLLARMAMPAAFFKDL